MSSLRVTSLRGRTGNESPTLPDGAVVTGIATVTGVNVTGVVTATTFLGDVTGNASSATVLASSRNIGGVAFNGSGDINLPGVNEAGTQNTSGTAGGLSGTPSITVGTITADEYDGYTLLDNSLF